MPSCALTLKTMVDVKKLLYRKADMGILGKFELDQCDLPTMIENLAILFRGLTINIDKNNIRSIPWIIIFLNLLGGSFYFYVYIFSMIWFVIFRCPQIEDVTICFLEISLGMCSASAVMKFVYIKLYEKPIRILINEYLQYDRLIIPETRFAENFLKILRVVKKRALVIWIAFTVNGAVYMILPFLMPGRHLTEDLYVIYGLEPILETPNYEIATTLMIPAITFGVFIMAEIAIFVVVIVGYIEAQMLALSDEVLHLWADSELFYEKFAKKYNNVGIIDQNIVKSIFIKSQLRDIAKFHIMNIKLCNSVQKKFRIIYFVEIIVILCAIVAELLGGLENTYVQVPYTFHQIFLDCWISQKLLDASIVFETALYSSQWEKFDVTNQKSILLMLRNSQNTLSLSAGGIAVFNYPFLMYVIRFTYSTYTTLQTTVNQKN